MSKYDNTVFEEQLSYLQRMIEDRYGDGSVVSVYGDGSVGLDVPSKESHGTTISGGFDNIEKLLFDIENKVEVFE